MRTQFTLENLKNLDFGVVSAAFDVEMATVTRDCQERPMDKRPRKVVLSINVVPDINTNSPNNCADHLIVECEVNHTIPKQRSKAYKMATTKDAMVVFQPMSPDDPNQMDIADEMSRKEEHRE